MLVRWPCSINNVIPGRTECEPGTHKRQWGRRTLSVSVASLSDRMAAIGSGFAGKARAPERRFHPKRLFLGKPFGGRRPASARLPIQSRRSAFSTVQVRPDESFQVRPSFMAKTLPSETPPSL